MYGKQRSKIWKFSKARQAVRMDDKNSIKIDNESFNLESELLFMWLVQIAVLYPDKFQMNDILKFEYC